MKKITRATVKSFISKNISKLLIKELSSFNGMTDCVEMVKDGFSPAKITDYDQNTLGVNGAWFVGHSRDMFAKYEDDTRTGIEVYNCCGSFVLAINK